MLQDLTYEFVRETFLYDPVSGEFIWRKSIGGKSRRGLIVTHTSDNGYITVIVKGTTYLVHRVIWLWMTGKWPENTIDHKNHVKTDNRWDNLREATRNENQRYRKKHKSNKTGYKGVCFDKNRKKYRAAIEIGGRCKFLGHFETAEEAYEAYTKFAEKVHGEFFHP
jgi:hypothetical protein